MVDLDLASLPRSEHGTGEIPETIDRQTGCLTEAGNKKGRRQMRQVMLDMVNLRFDLNSVARLQFFLDGCRAADVFDLLGHQFWMRPMCKSKSEPAQIIRARFAIHGNVIDFLQL